MILIDHMSMGNAGMAQLDTEAICNWKLIRSPSCGGTVSVDAEEQPYPF